VRRGSPIERASPNDMMQMATDVGPVPMQVGAVLVLGSAAGFDVGRAHDELAVRIRGVPRLRQRLVRTPPGCGRPVWVDDEAFAVDDHVHVRACPAPGDEQALLAVATEVLGRRLPADRPPWSATFVTDLAGGGTALVIVFDHVLADGIGGLAVLASLVDGMPPPPGDPGFPRPAPSWRALALDAASQRARALTRWRAGLTAVRDALVELKPDLRAAAPRSSLNRPSGPRRATRAVHVDLEAVRATAHGQGATVNDVVLAAVTGALHDLLDRRGEGADRFVISIPISGRRAATSDDLGNDVGVIPVDLPATGSFDERLDRIARITRARKDAGVARGSSAVLVGPLFRVLARLHLARRFMDHQRLINTLVTNLRGPDDVLAFAGAPITAVIPISVVTGNVTVAFAVLSYAGTLTITVNSDADACPDLDTLQHLLEEQLGAVR
jgi:WS/DGAT/MGAT family acyltransferase